jgi:hypothetical protein
MSTPLTSELIISALGSGVSDERLRQRFAAAELFNWPDVNEDREGAWNVEYWRHGCALSFSETEGYEKLYGSKPLEGSLAVAAIYFYAEGVNGFHGFEGSLPFGLDFSMTPEEVHAIIGNAYASRSPYGSRVDLFYLKEHALNICFNSKSGKIGFVEIRKKNIYEYALRSSSSVRWTDYSFVIGMPPSHEDTLRHLVEHIGIPVAADELSQFECDEFRKDFGLTFYSSDIESLEWPEFEQLPGQKARILTGVKFDRAGNFNSSGFKGRLPFDIEFSDDPISVISKLPATGFNAPLSEVAGHYGFVHEDRYYHIYFSIVFWQIIAISVFHPALTPRQ